MTADEIWREFNRRMLSDPAAGELQREVAVEWFRAQVARDVGAKSDRRHAAAVILAGLLDPSMRPYQGLTDKLGQFDANRVRLAARLTDALFEELDR